MDDIEGTQVQLTKPSRDLSGGEEIAKRSTGGHQIPNGAVTSCRQCQKRKELQPLSCTHQNVTVDEQRAGYATSFYKIEADVHYAPTEHHPQRDIEQLFVWRGVVRCLQSDDCPFVTHFQLCRNAVESAGPTHLCVNKSPVVGGHEGKKAVFATEVCNMHEQAISWRRDKLQCAPAPMHHLSIGCFAC